MTKSHITNQTTLPKVARVLSRFTANIAPAGQPALSRFFDQGEVIDDPGLTKRLLESGCPIGDVEDQSIAFCEKCRSACKYDGTEVTVTVNRCSLIHGIQFFRWEAGQVLDNPLLIAELQKQGVPLKTASGYKCPKCGHVGY